MGRGIFTNGPPEGREVKNECMKSLSRRSMEDRTIESDIDLEYGGVNAQVQLKRLEETNTEKEF